jgi:uncharacterized coiled-coil DUF342 family protein
MPTKKELQSMNEKRVAMQELMDTIIALTEDSDTTQDEIRELRSRMTSLTNRRDEALRQLKVAKLSLDKLIGDLTEQ